MALDDRSLVTRIGAGDDHAFTELAERHRSDREAYTRAKASFIERVLASGPWRP